MIRNDREYEEARTRYAQDREVIAEQRALYEKEDFSPEEVNTLLEPTLAFQTQLGEELSWYENVRRGTVPPAKRLTEIGRLLIAVRIASNVSQRELAKRLGVTEPQVSRDERNEYHGINPARAQQIFDVLGWKTTVIVEGDLSVTREAQSPTIPSVETSLQF